MSKRIGMKPMSNAATCWFLKSLLVVACLSSSVFAGGNNNGGFGNGGFNFNNVGGVKIDANGIIQNTSVEDRAKLIDFLKRSTKAPEGELGKKTEIRMVSLKGLEAAIQKANVKELYELPAEIRYLAGLQRIQYIFLYPEKNDIVIAGPAEGWEFNDEGIMVGKTTRRPVLQLADLMTSLQTARSAGEGQGISVSIDPTQEGRQRYSQFMRQIRGLSPQVLAGARQAMGPQEIKLTGVPTNSRYARILVAADYQMKRLAMDLKEAPVGNLPSFLDLMQKRRSTVAANVMPRWWLACSYEPIAKSGDGLAFEIKGQGVKAMTEDELVTAEGEVIGTGRKNPIAEQWANQMTEKYDELSVAETVFGELRNIMDMSVVGALVVREQMLRKVNLELPVLTGKVELDTPDWPTPRAVDTQCSFMKVGRNTVVTASGGVLVDSWGVADKQEESPMVGLVRTQADADGMSLWWWN